jgi:hypothetical protein
VADRSPAGSAGRDNPDWSADHSAVSVARMANPDGSTAVVGLQHVAYPFSRIIESDGLQGELEKLASDYVDRVKGVAGISDEIAEMLRQDKRLEFGWIDMSWGGGETGRRRRPEGSYTVARRADDGEVIDRTVCLRAGYRLKDRTSRGGETGLRVVIHLAVDGSNTLQARVTGITLSNLPAKLARRLLPPGLVITTARLELLRLHHGAEQISVQGVVPDDPSRLGGQQIFGNGRTAGGRVFAFVTETSNGGGFKTVASVDLVSAATAPTAFASDPQSCGPGGSFTPRVPVRPHERLDMLRSKTSRLVPTLQQAGLFEVRQTPIGHPDGDNDPTLVQSIDLSRLPLRSDALSAAHAFLRGDELMQRFKAYNLPTADYFRRARLPIVLRHRAPLKGARNGNAVNAQVDPDTVAASLPAIPLPPAPPPHVEVSFGAANLRRRGLVEVTTKRWRLQPAGIAADRRWAWHEFCHVLNYASFGKTEFRFAHSAGDALAAIVCDPDSVLGKPDPKHEFARHITFPWVALGRRHDRDAGRGWACCGRRNIARLASSTAFDNQRRGYFEEQLLSSALFRFYRSIGGDCANRDDRRAASDYCIYLIMRAIAQLDPIVPTRTIDAFVDELMQADSATRLWDVIAAWPENTPTRTLHRVGGCVHKVMRWAFERQGLYATGADPRATFEGVGKPPPVDIFIANARPAEAGGAPPEDGGYWPVPLQWSKTPQPWHASDNGIKLASTGRLVITVRNRGTQTATGVVVACWLWPVAAASPAPTYDPPWPAPASPAQDVAPGAAVGFEFDPGVPLTGTKRYFVFAVATCHGDRANIDAASSQPCATLGAPLLDLVANDNNLGVRILTL